MKTNDCFSNKNVYVSLKERIILDIEDLSIDEIAEYIMVKIYDEKDIF